MKATRVMSSSNKDTSIKAEMDALVKIEQGGSSLSDPSNLLHCNLPSTAKDFLRHQFHQAQAGRLPKYLIAFVTQRMARTQRDLESEFPGAQQAVSRLIQSIHKVIHSTTPAPSDEERMDLRFILTSIMGDNPNARAPYAFPIELQLDAAAALDSVNNWLPVRENAAEAELVAESSTQKETTPSSRAPKKRTSNEQEQQPLTNVSNRTIKEVLRGISDSDKSSRRSYYLSDRSTARNCNIIGDNGIEVGTWWPYRICALRDGAHGSMQSGIAGSIANGAYSIVVSGHYADLDKDNGNTIYYSGSKAHDNTDANYPIFSTSTRALQTSKRENRSVRVIRAAGGNFKYAPSVGLRYDGLYKIIEEALPLNHRGGRYVRFTLVRNSGQVEINLARPNTEERAVFERLKGL